MGLKRSSRIGIGVERRINVRFWGTRVYALKAQVYYAVGKPTNWLIWQYRPICYSFVVVHMETGKAAQSKG